MLNSGNALAGPWPAIKHPSSEKARQFKRDLLAETARLKTEKAAHRIGLSLRCADGDHGCLNDGSTCLCRCHDK